MHDVLAVGVDALFGDFGCELDDVGEVDEFAVLRLALLDPAAVTAPMGQVMNLPALALEADVVLVLGAHGIRSPQVVVHRIDRLERRCDRVAK